VAILLSRNKGEETCEEIKFENAKINKNRRKLILQYY